VQIEDILIEYYGNLGAGHRDFGSFYTEDGVLDVNGVESRGKKAIDDLYAKLEQPNVPPRGTLHMLMTNPVIRVNGDSATADVVFVKLGGRWYIQHRWVTSDSGLPAIFEKTYKQR
jgi:SnoaL-like domain